MFLLNEMTLLVAIIRSIPFTIPIQPKSVMMISAGLTQRLCLRTIAIETANEAYPAMSTAKGSLSIDFMTLSIMGLLKRIMSPPTMAKGPIN